MSNAAYIENGVDGITVLVKYCSLGWQSLRHVGTHTRIFRARLCPSARRKLTFDYSKQYVVRAKQEIFFNN